MPKRLKETNHDYQGCTMGNFYSNDTTGRYESWEEFKHEFYGFPMNGGIAPYDDTYHFVFRYDIFKQDDNNYKIELCIMLQRKGIYSNITVRNIDRNTLNTEVKQWLKDRSEYLKSLWCEVL